MLNLYLGGAPMKLAQPPIPPKKKGSPRLRLSATDGQASEGVAEFLPQPLLFRSPECLPVKVSTTAGTARIFCERTAGPNKEKKE